MLLYTKAVRSPIVAHPLSYSEKLHLHEVQGNSTDLRAVIFGHPHSIMTFTEGFLAKTAGPGESKFYEAYQTELSEVLAPDLVPHVMGLVFPTGDPNYFDLQRGMKLRPDEGRAPMILQRDITAGYSRPAIIDFKVGNRSWRIGASSRKASRRAAKIAAGPCAGLYFRVRAAMWYSRSPKFDKVPGTSVCYVSRKFGNGCKMNELHEMFADFFRLRSALPFFIEKLERLKTALKKLRDFYGTRFYSSSVVVAYDDADPEICDLRMLDFEKSYLDAEQVARKYSEPIEDCEDHVAEAVENLQIILIDLLENAEQF
jgi:1D-myo-inositol-tetrakisphosphate 5-kinase/inositol-polyphosphate multikinase